MRRARYGWLVGVSVIALLGCDDGDARGAGDAGAIVDAAAPETFAQQVALGGTVYGENCASCHGAAGEGTVTGPRLVGLAEGALPLEPRDGAVRTTEFVTVADVAGFAVANMPPTAPGSLAGEEYWAILAFALSANGITLDQKLTPELAATLVIPREAE